MVGSSRAPTDSADLQQEVLDKLDSSYYKAVDDTKLHTAAIDGMVAALDDPYTVYWDPRGVRRVQGEHLGLVHRVWV